MKFLDLKKYISSYIYIALSFIGMYFILLSNTHPSKENEFLNSVTFEFGIGIISIICSFICIGILIVEITIKRFIIPKYFPNLKFNIRINILPKFRHIFSFIFYILFLIASTPLIITLIAYFIWL